ncbi:MAG: hypothetical protein KKE77_02120 [Alphaproteobacteria bacterium]|nr:hypothetical protein [Alphaproteobacteria bacterium]
MNNNRKDYPMPTKEQQDRAERVQHAVIAELNLLAREGVSNAELLAGMGSAVADLITCTAGPVAVAPWFERQAELVRELQRP